MISFAFLNLTATAQSTLKGRIRDTAQKKDCPLAVVSILAADSTLIHYARTKKDGSFLIDGLSSGGYRLLVTHPAYSAYMQSIIIKSDSLIDLGTISPPPRAQDLAAVIVTPRVRPPRMKGDTLEYDAENVRTRVNATIEELLMRLPGVQVDQNGNITVNGRKIERLLVDGEDFFSGDPKIVTRNFNADMISKVQILDRKNDQSQFTGIDDGKRTTTLNVTLKESSKKGYFGKLEAGADPQGYYNFNSLLGAFKNHRQFAALGMAGNIGSTGFSGDVGSFGSGLNIGGGGGDALGASAGTGIPRVIGGGVHYADQLNDNGDHLVGDYAYGRLSTDPYSSSIVKQILPDTIYTQRQESRSHNISEQHTFNADYDYVPDTISAFHFSVGSMNSNERNQFQQTGSSTFNDTLVNDSYRKIDDNTSNQHLQSTIMWRIRGRQKKQRRFSIVTGFTKQKNSTDGYLYSVNSFYKHDGSILNRDSLDQRKIFAANALIINSSLNYVEPLWKNTSLGLSYGLSFNRSKSLLSTFDRGDGKYQNYVDSLSSNYRNDVTTHKVTISLQSADKNLGYSLGGDILKVAYIQHDLVKSFVQRYNYANFNPHLYLWHNLNSNTGFHIRYNGSSQQPSISQLQPLQNNNDPLHLIIGNPDLKPGFMHNVEMAFHNLRPFVFNLGLNYGFSTKSISTRTYTDSLGRQISQSVNTEGGSNENLFFSLNHQLKKMDVDATISFSLGHSRNFNYINQFLSKNDSYNWGAAVFANRFISNKYSLHFFSNLLYNYSQSSINAATPTHYFTSDNSINATLLNVVGFEINTTLNFKWRQKSVVFDHQNATALWNGFIGRNFLKNQLSIRWQVNDILNQNVNINRSITANQTSETSTNITGRYWLLTATWRFINNRKSD